MPRYAVYQQVVTKTKKVRGVEYDIEVRVLFRKVDAKNRKEAIDKFKKDIENIKIKRGSKIACFNFDHARTVK